MHPEGNPITSPLAGHEMADVMIANHNVKARAIAWMENQKAKGREYRLL
jgi:hypothetical protein